MVKLAIGTGIKWILPRGAIPVPPNTLVAGRGVFIISGDTMSPAYNLGMDLGTFALSGGAVTFSQGTVPILSAALGTFVLTGNAVTLLGANNIAASQGAFVLSGAAAGVGIGFAPVSGTFALTGNAVTLTAPATFAGVGDVASNVVKFYGLRAYNAAYATGANPAIDIVDGSGANTQTINITSSGGLDLAAVNTWVTAHGSTIKVTKIYEQTGSGTYLFTGTVANMPALILGVTIGSSTFPVLRFNGTSSDIPMFGSFSQAQPYTMGAVYQRTGRAGSLGVLFGGPTVGLLLTGASGSAAGMFGGSGFTTATATENSFHALQGVFDDAGTGSSLNVDGSATSTTGTGTTSLGALNSGDDGNARFFQGDWTELFVQSGHSANIAAVNSNQHSYYGGF